MLEKPISHTIEGVEKILEIQKAKNLVGLMGYCLRHDAAARRFKEMIEYKPSGEFLHARVECGSYLPEWRPKQDYRQSVSAKRELGGGVLLELSHELDYIRWFFGPLRSVIAVLHNSGTLGLKVEESAELIFKTTQGIPITVHLDFNSRSTRRCCTARYSDGDLIWNIVEKSVAWRSTSGNVKRETFDCEDDEMYRQQLLHFFDSIENNKTPAVSLDDGVEVLRMVDAARESHSSGKIVDL